jgi:hypothetical protein
MPTKERLRKMKRMLLVCGTFLAAALLTSAQQGLTLQVQIHYTGSGTVDENHKIFVALWDSPDFPAGGGPPVAVLSTTSKDGTVTFSDVQKSPAYASTAYDPTGQWDGQSGPPPTGTSLGMYSKAPPTPDPITLTPGKVAKVTITFDDTAKVQ